MDVEELYRALHAGDGGSEAEALRAARLAGANGGAVMASACLLGIACRHDGGDRKDAGVLRRLAGRPLIPLCPEVLGGLGVPRPPVRRAEDGRVTREDGTDATLAMERGAARALLRAEAAGARVAILKERSPSCGVRRVHGPDGTRPGAGVFAELLRTRGVLLLTEEEEELAMVPESGAEP